MSHGTMFPLSNERSPSNIGAAPPGLWELQQTASGSFVLRKVLLLAFVLLLFALSLIILFQNAARRAREGGGQNGWLHWALTRVWGEIETFQLNVLVHQAKAPRAAAGRGWNPHPGLVVVVRAGGSKKRTTAAKGNWMQELSIEVQQGVERVVVSHHYS